MPVGFLGCMKSQNVPLRKLSGILIRLSRVSSGTAKKVQKRRGFLVCGEDVSPGGNLCEAETELKISVR